MKLLHILRLAPHFAAAQQQLRWDDGGSKIPYEFDLSLHWQRARSDFDLYLPKLSLLSIQVCFFISRSSLVIEAK